MASDARFNSIAARGRTLLLFEKAGFLKRLREVDVDVGVLVEVDDDAGRMRFLPTFGESTEDVRRLLVRPLEGEFSTSAGSGRLRVRVGS